MAGVVGGSRGVHFGDRVGPGTETQKPDRVSGDFGGHGIRYFGGWGFRVSGISGLFSWYPILRFFFNPVFVRPTFKIHILELLKVIIWSRLKLHSWKGLKDLTNCKN